MNRGMKAGLFLFAATLACEAAAESFSGVNLDAYLPSPVGFSFGFDGQEDRIYLHPDALKRNRPRDRVALPHLSAAGAAIQVRNLIAAAEAGAHGYDAVQYGARVKPPKRPTEMTITEINDWIDETPGQPHAIGRYQFIPSTLRSLLIEAGINENTVFSAQVQDLLADILLEDAGFTSFMEGRIGRHRFMENLARIWAGLPTSDGLSYYEGYAGNRAVITWSEFDDYVKKVFEQETGARSNT